MPSRRSPPPFGTSRRRRRLGPTLALLVAAAASAACQEPLAGPLSVEAIVRDTTTGEYGLDVVTLTTPTDLWRGEGSRFYVLRDLAFDKALRNEATDTARYPSVDNYLEANRARSGGSPPVMALHQEGDTWVADDFDTLMLVSAWVALERTLGFFEAVGDDTGATQATLLVAQYGQVAGLGLPEVAADNAAYLALLDGMFLFPTWLIGDLQASLPLPANEGVIAHELGHRMFFFNVHVAASEEVWRSDTADPSDGASANRLRAVNEGVADLFAIGVTGDTNFGGPSALGDDRNVDTDVARALTYADAVNGSASCSLGSPVDDANFSVYCLGTTVASVVWEAGGGDLDVYRGEVMPAVVRALRQAGARMQAAWDNGDGLVFDVEDFLAPLAEELPTAATHDRLCQQLTARFASKIEAGEVPSCL